MKISMVTKLDRDNMAECLRIWALKQTLQKRDCYVKILNIQEDEKFEGLANRTNGMNQFEMMFPDYMCIKSKEQAKEEFENISYCFVTGSSIWDSVSLKLANKALLLNNVQDKKAYASGIQIKHHTLLEKLLLRRKLKRFSLLTVCDSETKKYLKKVTGRDAKIVCDNSFLLRKKEYDQIKQSVEVNGKFLLADQKYKESSLIEELVSQVVAEENIQVFWLNHIGNVDRMGRDIIVESPGQFLGYLEQAEYVLTDNFDTLVFALIYKKPFLMADGRKKEEQAKKLLFKLKLSENYLTNKEQYVDIESFKLANAGTLYRRLAEEKKNAYAVINKMVGISEKEEYVKAPTGILKKDCCGCYACQEVCPKDAIKMKEDKNGYFFPVVNEELCVHCGLCKETCIIQNPRKVSYEREFPYVVAAYNKDMGVRENSSSGGVFPALSEYVILTCHGYVAGAKYDEKMNVISDIASNMDEVKQFYGSKYAKSRLDGSYRRIKKLLLEGNMVLFSGLPCECSALRSYLKKEYEKLYICEIMCHAVPSSKVFKKYLKYLEKKFKSKITNVIFRQKKRGWLPHQTSMVVEFDKRKSLRVVNRTNNYYRIFANDIIARESCTACRFTSLNRAGDLTIGDFWGVNQIHPEIFDNMGTSFIMINNEQGLKLWECVKDKFEWMESNVENIFSKNHSKPISYSADRDEFLKRFEMEPVNDLLEEFNDLKN